MIIAYRWIGGLVVALVVLLGIYRVENGLQNLFDGRGQDRVEAGDEVGELTILSTRHLVVRTTSLFNIALGFCLIFGSVASYHYLEKRLHKQNEYVGRGGF